MISKGDEKRLWTIKKLFKLFFRTLTTFCAEALKKLLFLKRKKDMIHSLKKVCLNYSIELFVPKFENGRF